MQVSSHAWRVSPAQARQIQLGLAGSVRREGRLENPAYIAGMDISVKRFAPEGTAAVVVLSYPGLEVLESRVQDGPIGFPYVPGLLSFREAPLLLETCAGLRHRPDLIMVDGQGIAHPRRLGLAAHLGLLLDVPAIGCAKSRLCGAHEAPGNEAGSRADLTDGDEVIGAVLRTKTGVKPLYISIGHRIGLEEAVRWVLACCRGYRLPEPTRLAHLAAGGNLKVA
jgi:deoxyribonuclease V